VELALMRSGEHDDAREYERYREKRSQELARSGQQEAPVEKSTLNVNDNGTLRPLDLSKLRTTIVEASEGLPVEIDVDGILKETVKNLDDGIPVDEVYKSAILSARAMVETDPAYRQVTAGLLLHTIRKEVLGQEVAQSAMNEGYAEYFPRFIKAGIENSLLDQKLVQFYLPRHGSSMKAELA